MGSIAEIERDLIRERTVAGIGAARQPSRRIGQPRVHVPSERAQVLLREGLSRGREPGIVLSKLKRACSKDVGAEG